jgi:hypothetical protein
MPCVPPLPSSALPSKLPPSHFFFCSSLLQLSFACTKPKQDGWQTQVFTGTTVIVLTCLYKWTWHVMGGSRTAAVKIALVLPILIQTVLSQLCFCSVVAVLRVYSIPIVCSSMPRGWWACTVVIGEDFSWHALRINYTVTGFTGRVIFNFLKQSSV